MGVRRLGATVVSGGGLDSKARLRQIEQYRPDVMLATPTYALYLGETAREIGMDLAKTSITHMIVSGEPGGSIPATRQAIEELWGARCYELYGIAELGPTNPGCPLRERRPPLRGVVSRPRRGRVGQPGAVQRGGRAHRDELHPGRPAPHQVPHARPRALDGGRRAAAGRRGSIIPAACSAAPTT